MHGERCAIEEQVDRRRAYRTVHTWRPACLYIRTRPDGRPCIYSTTTRDPQPEIRGSLPSAADAAAHTRNNGADIGSVRVARRSQAGLAHTRVIENTRTQK